MSLRHMDYIRNSEVSLSFIVRHCLCTTSVHVHHIKLKITLDMMDASLA